MKRMTWYGEGQPAGGSLSIWLVCVSQTLATEAPPRVDSYSNDDGMQLRNLHS